MATQKQIEANRKNAGKSTGPRTAEGKQKSRMNSLKHGLRYCETGFAESYRQALSYLNLVGHAARPGRRDAGDQAASSEQR